jgi:hypothetical protein
MEKEKYKVKLIMRILCLTVYSRNAFILCLQNLYGNNSVSCYAIFISLCRTIETNSLVYPSPQGEYNNARRKLN